MNNSGKIYEDRENDAYKIYQGLNGDNDFKHREAYKILDPDGPPAPQSAGPNYELDGSLYEGGSKPIGQKLFRNNFAIQKALDGVVASGSGIQTMLDELQLEKKQAKEENKRRRVEANQQWQAKMDLEQVREDRKIMEKDLSNLSGHQFQYYLQRQAEVKERLANRGRPGT
ncbi:hypothetical protein GIB67_036122 [Kingdonia uniflora]|uniref:No apical meristem-associated C-terminal domain-containing protein n=1 Tax=Kingdonia uniflora TaxID=39325 RepID=A0A7J7N9H0_9MAGN|nr:hypothetical protein GIB67_036122 [Kingdonia uniflora]